MLGTQTRTRDRIVYVDVSSVDRDVIVATSDYDPMLVNAFRSVPSRRWGGSHDRNNNYFDIYELSTLLDALRLTGYTLRARRALTARLNEIAAERRKYAAETMTDTALNTAVNKYEYVTLPYQYQRDGFRALIARAKFGLFDEMGLGKTKQAIDALRYRMFYERSIDRAVIITPAAAKRVWHNPAAPETGQLVQHGAFDPDDIILVEGARSLREDLLLSDAYKIYIINFESAIRCGLELNDRAENQMLIIDEAHRISNRNSQTGKLVRSLAPKFLMLLTGTPVYNRPEQFYHLAHLIAPGVLASGWDDFRNKYCVTEGWTGGKVVGYQNLDKLREKAAAFTLRRLKKDVLDLPPKNYIPILVEMNQTQRRIYNRVESEIRTEIETDQGNITVSMFHAITRLTRLLQVADGVVSNGDQVTFLPKRDNAKLRALDDIIDDQLEAKKKTVIWTRYRTAANGILDHMIARGVICARIVGGQTPNARAEEIRRFQEDDDCMVLVGVIQAGGIAITITSAQEAVFYDRWWVHSDNKQAEDRIHRIGTRGAVTYLTITAIGTKDELVDQLLRRNEKAASGVTGDELGDSTWSSSMRALADGLATA